MVMRGGKHQMGTMGQEGAPSAGPTPRYRHPRRLPGGGDTWVEIESGATVCNLSSLFSIPLPNSSQKQRRILKNG